jgi:hypothetical protein
LVEYKSIRQPRKDYRENLLFISGKIFKQAARCTKGGTGIEKKSNRAVLLKLRNTIFNDPLHYTMKLIMPFPNPECFKKRRVSFLFFLFLTVCVFSLHVQAQWDKPQNKFWAFCAHAGMNFMP